MPIGPPQLAAGDWIDLGARRWPDQRCLVSGERSQTFAETARRVNALAAGMAEQGLQSGDRVAVLATDSIEHVELILACLKAGVTFCDLNFRLRPAELDNIVGRAGVAGIFHSSRYGDVVDDLARTHGLRSWTLDGPDYRDLLTSGSAGSAPTHARARGEDIVSIAFTSGTTGTPKGVLQSERMIRNIVYSGIREIDIRPGGFRYSGASLFHISGIGSVLYALAGGCGSLILEQFDAPQVLEWMQSGGLTHCTLIPTMISSLLALPGARSGSYPALRSIMYGGAAITPALLRDVIATFGCDLYNGFGAGTEAGGQTMLSAADHRRAMDGAEHLLGSIGMPILGVDLRLCDDQLRDVPQGEVGEIVTRSETIMSGYLDQPDLTARSIVDGWFRAGDMASMDADGYLFLATRKADMIIRGGENVYPNEIESVLADHPAVAAAAVVGVPDDHWGEVVGAAVVLRDGERLEPEALQAYCRERIASYKVPQEIRFLPSLPTNATGKVVKSALAAEFRPVAAPGTHT